MPVERRFAEFATYAQYEEFPRATVDFVKSLILGVVGTAVAGATQIDSSIAVDLAREWGGKEEATIFVYGNKVPAYNAAFANSVMARALDYEDGMPPGVHVGASVIPTALAAAELAGGCSGKEFIVAVTIGAEIIANLASCSLFDGFDPTGILSVIGASATAGRIIGLNVMQMRDALALAFNRSGGSFQSNIDGSLAVASIQGFTSQNAIICAQLAQRGITGPENFIKGIYGYLHLYGKDKFTPEDLTRNLGKTFLVHKALCKKYPSCGCTLSATNATLELVKEKEGGFSPKDIKSIEVRVTPYSHKLVGHDFKIGGNPRVDAQFNIQYCVANAILRGRSKLEDFEESSIRDPRIMELVEKIRVIPDSFMMGQGTESTLSAHVKIVDTDGVFEKLVEFAPGMPENPMTREEHLEHFRDCMSYARKPLSPEKQAQIISFVDLLEEVKDVRELMPLTLAG
ncbi:MAG: 2-methylcitrate dehydratase [Syntrophorhabdaceae bacterium PtaU1.Bin034]|nr:MAG: 2-methylcitrate dehydratase [Syntrophorhabdaceae bacterium PtaU1.Bin034]